MDTALKTQVDKLHPVLKYLVNELSSEVNLDYLLNPSDNKRIALNLISEKTGGKIVKGYRSESTRVKDSLSKMLSPRLVEIPIYDDEIRFRVSFGYVGKRETRISQEVFLLDLADVKDETQGIGELEMIAANLREAYKFPYNPPVYNNGVIVHGR